VSRVELDAVLDALLAQIRPVAEARGIRVDTTIERGATVFGDPARIEQIVRHLLSNAIKFSNRGGFVHLDARREGASATIVVRDQGIGIAPEFLPHVFDRFRRADASITRRRGGLGLGLAIAQHLVELHGGRLAADSEGEGRGASFTLVLPIRSAASGLALLGSGLGESASVPDLVDLSDINVVAVDDESDVRHLLEALLENRGARVWTAASVREALALIPAVRPDVLLVDIGMADEDGYSLVRKLRAQPAEEGGRTPAIALTAYARDEDRRRALEAGCQLHVAKPVEPDLLLRAIAQVVAEDRTAMDATHTTRRTRGV
jgi:CheY-like chemotaxis protein